jgi:RHS repeat-associated protein
VTYGYDNAGAMTEIRENGSTVLASFGYDNFSHRQTLSRTNGATTSYSYDSGSRLATLTQDLPGSANDLTRTLQYNPASQITDRTDSTSIYAGVNDPSQAFSVNGLNQLTTANAATVAYSALANLRTDGVNNYTYDADNRLNTANGASVTYDSLDRLVKVAGSSGSRQYGYDSQMVVGEFDAAGAMVRRYIHGPGFDEPLVVYDGSGTSNRHWLGADERGSIIVSSNGVGAADYLNTYDEYGVRGASNQGLFQFTGQTWLPEANAYNFKARFYSPSLRRFLQPDPLGVDAGRNLYAYVDNDPMNRVDPTGKDPCRFEGGVSVCPFLLLGAPNQFDSAHPAGKVSFFTGFDVFFSNGLAAFSEASPSSAAAGVPRSRGQDKRACNAADFVGQTFRAGAAIAITTGVVAGVTAAAAPTAAGVGAATLVAQLAFTGATLAGFGTVGADFVAGGYRKGVESGLSMASDEVVNAAVEGALGKVRAGAIGAAKAAIEFAAGPDCVR